MKKLLTAITSLALASCAVSPAYAKDDWEKAYLAASAVDTAQTCYGISKGLVERNPIFGKSPKCETLVAAKLGAGIVHWLIYKEIARRDQDDAETFAKVSFFVQGGIVGWNFTKIF